MSMVPDGFNILEWDEFKAFCLALGADPKRYVMGLIIDIPLDKVYAHIRYSDHKPVQYKPVLYPLETLPIMASGFDIWRWPTFKALANRMGVFYDAYTKELSLTIMEGESPMIRQSYVVVDMTTEKGNLDMPIIVHTTS